MAKHEEGYSSYWLLTPFKLYAYWWSFAFAYFSGEHSALEPGLYLMNGQRRASKALMLPTPCKLYTYCWSFVFAYFSGEHLASSACLCTDSSEVIACAGQQCCWAARCVISDATSYCHLGNVQCMASEGQIPCVSLRAGFLAFSLLLRTANCDK